MTKEQALALFEAFDVFLKKPHPRLGTQAFDEWESEHGIFLEQIHAALKEHPKIEVAPPVIRGVFVPAKRITNEPPSPSK